MKRAICLTLIFVMAVSFAFARGGGDRSSEVIRLRLAENQPRDNPITIGMFRFADLVREKTGGTVEIEVFPDAMLGNETETIDQIHAGTLDFARVNTSALAATADAMALYTLPFIFISYDHKYRVLDGEIGRASMATLERTNMVGLEFWEAGSRHFYTTRTPIRQLSDMRGLRIRVQPSEVAIRMVGLLGAVATPMAYGEVFQALQTGVIDGAENDFVSYYTSGHYEAARNLSLSGHMAPPAVLLASKRTFDRLSASQQQAIREAAREAAIWQRQAMNDFQDESRRRTEAAGTTVYQVNVVEFQNAVGEIYDSYPQFRTQIEAIKALQ